MTSQKFKDSQRVGVNHITGTRKYIFLPLMVKGCLRENVATAAKCADSSQRSVRSVNGTCMVVIPITIMGAIALTKCVISVA